MTGSKVALITCTDYSPEAVYQACKRGISLLGGMSSFITEGETILLKPNMLTARRKEEACTTHPAVLEAFIRLLQEERVQITWGDSPGLGSPSGAAKTSGLMESAAKYTAAFADFQRGKEKQFPGNTMQKSFKLANGVLEADGIISLAKMKTHGFTNITGAVKNQLGCVYGLNKAKMHVHYPNVIQFCQMLVDLNMSLPMRLYVMDGIVAMEGNGPSAGDPVPMNVLLFSKDPVALDSVFCRLVDLNPSFIPTNTLGKKSGLGTWLEDEIEIVGDSLKDFTNKHFNVIRKEVGGKAILAQTRLFKNHMIRRPLIDKKKCTRCGICIETCPLPPCGKALAFKDNNKKDPPRYDYEKCIRCYCCQELCPQKAIYAKTPLLGRIFHNFFT